MTELPPHVLPLWFENLALEYDLNIWFYNYYNREHVNIRIESLFRAQMEYKRPDIGLKIYREALARLTEFSNLRLGVFTPYAHKKGFNP